METHPRVSVIIPIYNVEPYIIECLDSVKKQTVADKIELILVDDCGTDNSIAIAKQWLACIPSSIKKRYKLLHHDKNRGLSSARNTGVQAALGEYLYFLDSDDYLIPTAVEHLLTLADKYGGVDLLPALYLTEGHDMQQFGKHSFPEFSDDQRLIKKAILDYDRIPVTAANRLVRREFFLEHNLWFKEGIIHEDNYWTYFLAKHVKRMAFTYEKIYYYRTTEGSITKKLNIEKETKAFHTFIKDFSANIDPFESGAQKRLILYNLITILDNGYYTDDRQRNELVDTFASKNNTIERLLLASYLKTKNIKVLHLLEHIYNKGIIMTILSSPANIKKRIMNKLWYEMNPWIRENIIIPYIRHRMKGVNVTLLCNNCNGACILHDCGLKFNSPFVNLWLYPKDFIRYCSNINHYRACKLTFLKKNDIPQDYLWTDEYPIAKLDDIIIYFQHYQSQDDAANMWHKRSSRMDMNNVHAILVERDGCTIDDMKLFDALSIKKAILTQFPHPNISSVHCIRGFETETQLGMLMNTVKDQYLGRKYYDQFNYVSFLKN